LKSIEGDRSLKNSGLVMNSLSLTTQQMDSPAFVLLQMTLVNAILDECCFSNP